ncbi:UBN2_3 domain-containing protein [Cucumis melo var. makuwa]|uniref:UBN2_3 domain-containing protein n=1 Tax=Cucumis melo var. makuwa TaxID=1194695 RepID=A0A5D3C350_CUCMM|nr:UBN2_3 domain-containing protein [Cucumis melo var. makuwa]
MTTLENSTSGNSNTLASITSSDIDALLNPFMLHHSIIPTTNLVSTPQIGSNNYSSWSRAMMLALSGKNKVGFITGTIKKPSEGNYLLSAWKCNNDAIASWIINSISKEIAASLVYNGSVMR